MAAAGLGSSPPTDEASLIKILKGWGGTVSPAWVKANPSLKPLQGLDAVDCYYALKSANPNVTPLTLAQGVRDIWIGGSLAGAISGEVGTLIGALGDTNKGIAQGLSALNPFASIENALSAFWDKLTDGKMWRSLAWMLLGVILMFMGISLWIKGSINPLAALALAG